jgi:hypothetical protein
MSLNAMHRSIMIFSDTQQKAEDKLNEFATSLDELILKQSKDYIKTATRTIQARFFSEYCRGFRYIDVYIDNSLRKNKNAMEWIIMKLVPPHYYTNFKHDENYNRNDHIHFF